MCFPKQRRAKAQDLLYKKDVATRASSIADAVYNKAGTRDPHHAASHEPGTGYSQRDALIHGPPFGTRKPLRSSFDISLIVLVAAMRTSHIKLNNLRIKLNNQRLLAAPAQTNSRL